MVSAGPRSERGGTIAWTREPSGSRASTHGDESSTRRPKGPTMRSIRCRTDSSPSNSRSGTLSIRPSRSTNTSSDPFTITSVTEGSFNRNSIGPNPTTSSETSFTIRASSRCGRIAPCSRSSSSASSRTRIRRSVRGVDARPRASTRWRSWSRSSRRTSANLSLLTTPPAPAPPVQATAREPVERTAEAAARGKKTAVVLQAGHRCVERQHRERIGAEGTPDVARGDLAADGAIHDEPDPPSEAERRAGSSRRVAARKASTSRDSTSSTRSGSAQRRDVVTSRARRCAGRPRPRTTRGHGVARRTMSSSTASSRTTGGERSAPNPDCGVRAHCRGAPESSSPSGTRSAIVRRPRPTLQAPWRRRRTWSTSMSTHDESGGANACARCVATNVQPAPPRAAWTVTTWRGAPAPRAVLDATMQQQLLPVAGPHEEALRSGTDGAAERGHRFARGEREQGTAPGTGGGNAGSATTASGSSWRTASASCRSSPAVLTTRARPLRSRKCRTSSATSCASSASTTLAASSMPPLSSVGTPSQTREGARGSPTRRGTSRFGRGNATPARSSPGIPKAGGSTFLSGDVPISAEARRPYGRPAQRRAM